MVQNIHEELWSHLVSCTHFVNLQLIKSCLEVHTNINGSSSHVEPCVKQSTNSLLPPISPPPTNTRVIANKGISLCSITNVLTVTIARCFSAISSILFNHLKDDQTSQIIRFRFQLMVLPQTFAFSCHFAKFHGFSQLGA